MLTIDLNPAEEEILRTVLQEAVSDLGMEIAATEALDFRAILKERREVLNKVLASMQERQRV